MTIWKFSLEKEDRQDVAMPRGAKILCVQTQYGSPQLWALVDPEAASETRAFATYGTGHKVGDPGEYIGTYQLCGGGLVFHVFDVTGGVQ